MPITVCCKTGKIGLACQQGSTGVNVQELVSPPVFTHCQVLLDSCVLITYHIHVISCDRTDDKLLAVCNGLALACLPSLLSWRCALLLCLLACVLATACAGLGAGVALQCTAQVLLTECIRLVALTCSPGGGGTAGRYGQADKQTTGGTQASAGADADAWAGHAHVCEQSMLVGVRNPGATE